MKNKIKYSKNLNDCKLKHKVPCASFEENCAQTRTYSFIIPFNISGNHVLIMGKKKDLPQCSCSLRVLSMLLNESQDGVT